jgi:hypothetical protein
MQVMIYEAKFIGKSSKYKDFLKLSCYVRNNEHTRCDPKVLRRVVLKDYCALHLAADTITT